MARTPKAPKGATPGAATAQATGAPTDVVSSDAGAIRIGQQREPSPAGLATSAIPPITPHRAPLQNEQAPANRERDVLDAVIADQLHMATHTVTLDPGLYLIELGALDLPVSWVDGIELPLVYISSDPAERGQAEVVVTGEAGPWFGNAGGIAVVKASSGGADIAVTAFTPKHQRIPRAKVSIRRLDQAATAGTPTADARSPSLAGPDPVTAPTAEDSEFATLIERNGLFDAAFYCSHNGDVAAAGVDPALHYVMHGDVEGRKPNPWFDPVWYSKKYFDRPPPRGALRDYIETGERVGRKPCAVFDPMWYSSIHGLELARESALADYLGRRKSNTCSPNRYFDVAFYLDGNPDVRDADVDAFEHWLRWGIHENRKASPDFNAEFVWPAYLNNNRDMNAFETFMDIGLELGWDPVGDRAADRSFDVYRQLKRNCAPGPLFEQLAPPVIAPGSIPGSAPGLVKVLAFYLPQFHAIPENDEWWGAGFTEWHNIARGVPRYGGHYQPRIPRDLGFYDLGSRDVIGRQVELARRMGVSGFCFYYYNFNGQRLLEKPVDAFLANRADDFPFCLIWANENWTRRWDGGERDILIRQDYRRDEVAALVADFARHMRDPRYIRLADDRPLLMVYRPDVIPSCAETVALWREHFRHDHRLDPIIVMGQTFGITDPRSLGFDGALQFPPHNIASDLTLLNSKSDVEIYDIDFRGLIYDYNELVAASLALPEADFPLIRTACPGWDNDARRQGAGMSFAYATPEKFESWLRGLIERAHKQPFFGEPLLCINAWNEWCEGAYLEPDTHFGYAYLNAVARAVNAWSSPVSLKQARRPRPRGDVPKSAARRRR